MIKSILVVLDDSESSKSAIKLGVHLAKKYKASFTGIGILDTPWITMPEAIPLGGSAFKVDLEAKTLKAAEQHIHSLEKKFIEYCESQKISPFIIDTTGIPVEEIESFATEFDVLVMGKDANFHFMPPQKTTSTVKQVLKDSPRPLFITSPELPYQQSSDVVIAFDGTFASSRALHMAILMGIFKDKTLHIVSVSENEERVHQWINSAHKLCQHHGLKAHLHPMTSASKPSIVILDLISHVKPSLIVLGAYGHSTIRSFFMGSCAAELLKETDVPFFIFH